MKSQRSPQERDPRAELDDGTYSVLEPGFEEAPYSASRPASSDEAAKARAVARELAASSSRPPPSRSGIVPRAAHTKLAIDRERATALASRRAREVSPFDHESPTGGDEDASVTGADRAEGSALPSNADGASDRVEPPASAAFSGAAMSPVEERASELPEAERGSQPDAEPISLLHPKSSIVGARFVRTRTRVYTKTLPFLAAVDGAPASVPAPDVIELPAPASAPPSGYATPRAFPAQMVSAPPSSDSSWVRAAPREPRVSLASAGAGEQAQAPQATTTRASSMLLMAAVAVLVAALALVVVLEILARHP